MHLHPHMLCILIKTHPWGKTARFNSKQPGITRFQQVRFEASNLCETCISLSLPFILLFFYQILNFKATSEWHIKLIFRHDFSFHFLFDTHKTRACARVCAWTNHTIAMHARTLARSISSTRQTIWWVTPTMSCLIDAYAKKHVIHRISS